jgi:hypothetical protein
MIHSNNPLAVKHETENDTALPGSQIRSSQSTATTDANFGFEKTLERYDSGATLIQKFS